MNRSEKKSARSRTRWTLLVLLWCWAATMFLVVDLFLNVDAFDLIRPQASIYRGTRAAAHRMVGEPILDSEFLGTPPRRPALSRPPAPEPVSPFRRRLAELKQLGEDRLFATLLVALAEERDPRHRVAIMRVLAENFGEDARDALLSRMRDTHESEWVRAEAAYFVGWTGPGSFEVLDGVLRSSWPVPIRAGALRGLGRHGSVAAVQLAVGCIGEGSPPIVRAACEVMERTTDPAAVERLVVIASDHRRDERVRIAACRGMGRTRAATTVDPLAVILGDRAAPEGVRVAAIEALVLTGQRSALRIVSNHCDDESPVVATAAQNARLSLATAVADSHERRRNGT